MSEINMNCLDIAVQLDRMGNLILLSALLAGGLSFVNCFGEQMIGKGRYYVVNIMKCEEDDRMLYKLEVKRHKVNRTHDGFDGKINLEDAIDDSFAVRIDICKQVDGGCKPYQVLADDSFVRFIKQYAGGNIQRILEMAKADPPDFPLQPGYYEVDSFLFDYNELPENGQYGVFGAKTYILKNGLELGCLDVTVSFSKDDDD